MEENNKKELYLALLKSQSEYPKISKGTLAHKHKYATYDQVLEIVRPILNANGLYMEQPTHYDIEGNKILETRIIHVSTGQMSTSVVALVIDESKGLSKYQEEGSCMTYNRRYQLMSLLGLCAEDDDNDGQSIKKSTYSENKNKSGNISSGPSGTGITISSAPNILEELITNKQWEYLCTLLDEHEEGDNIEKEILKEYKISSLNQLTKTQATAWLDSLSEKDK